MTNSADERLLADVRRIADAVAAPNADGVDREARFPAESVDALREAKALSALIPAEYGGGGASFAAVAQACFELGRRCGSSAMVFAMHQIQVAVIVRHLDQGWFEDYLRDVAAGQRLIASVTSEVGTGGDMGRSVAAVEPGEDGRQRFVKQAPTASYAGHADDYLTTVRRSPEADPGEQVIVLSRGADTQLEQNGTWDTLGMRGTCSPSFTVTAGFAPEQVMATPFSTIAAESMVPCSHVLWSHLWLGIATDAFDRARAFVREAAKRSGGAPSPAGARLSHLMSELSLLRAGGSSPPARVLGAREEAGRPRPSTMASAP